MDLIKGRRGLEEEGENVENMLIVAKERQRAIRIRYGNKSLPTKEQNELERLVDEER